MVVFPSIKRQRRPQAAETQSEDSASSPASPSWASSDAPAAAPDTRAVRRRFLLASTLSLLDSRRLRRRPRTPRTPRTPRRRRRSASSSSAASTRKRPLSVAKMGSSSVPAPPYMLGERPAPAHGGSGAPTFRQVPFVRASERVESGVKVRKQLRKYLKAASTTQHMVAQMHLSDACLPALQPQEVAQSCFQDFFEQMRMYNQVLGTKHLAASKAYLEMTRPLESSAKSRRWARDVYNLVQRCVADVQLADKKMDKARSRVARAGEELAHWKTVLEANEATYQVQPNNPEVRRAFQLAQYRFANAFGEDEAAGVEYDDARATLLSAIARRDEVVEEATEFSQSVEEDRLDTLLIVIGQFVETKVAILQAEIEAMVSLQHTLKALDRDSVVQQYIVDSMKPDLTHRHAKALALLEWQRVVWHQERQAQQASEPGSYLALSAADSDDVAKLKSAGVSIKDVQVIKDFVASCFVEPDAALLSSSTSSSSGSLKHRGKFTDASAASTQAMYRLSVVRHVVLECLALQRSQSRELSRDGFTRLSTALRLLLDACVSQKDTRSTKHVMNMLQTFHKSSSSGKDKDKDKVYLHVTLADHPAWRVAAFWGDALLDSVGEELSKVPQDMPWYFLGDTERAQKVLDVHNVVYGQVSAYLYHLSSFGFSRKQLQQFARNVCFAYELGEEQRISLLSSVQGMDVHGSQEDELEEKPSEAEGPVLGDREPWTRESEVSDRTISRVPAARLADVEFTSFTLPDWPTVVNAGRTASTSSAGSTSTGTGGKFGRKRGGSTASNAPTTIESSTASYAGSVRDLEEMKMLASSSTGGTQGEESWEDLFGSGVGHTSASGSSASAAAEVEVSTTTGEDGDAMAILDDSSETSEKNRQRIMKRRKNSRKFNDQLRLARALPLSLRIHEDEGDAGVGDASSQSEREQRQRTEKQPPLPTAPRPAASRQLSRAHSSQGIVVPAAESSGSDLPPPHDNPRSSRSQEAFTVEDEAAVAARKERRRRKKQQKARSAASIDTTALEAERAAFADVDTDGHAVVTASPLTSTDQIRAVAAQMKQRRRASSSSTSINLPQPASTSAEETAASKSPEKKPALSGVAALRARFENA